MVQNAKRNYQSALAVLPGESYPKGKIDEIDKILLDQKNAAVAKVEKN